MYTQTPILEIKNLSKSFGKKQILRDINLTVYSGEVLGFLGPNGSGKTTTIKLMLGLLNIDEGSVSICGHDVRNDFERAVSYVGGIIENPEMYKYLTGRQNLMQYRRMNDTVTDERFEEVIDIVGLRARIDDKISKYSLGMRQRLGIAQAIMHHPRLLVLDEPTNGLDPMGIKELRDILKKLSHEEGCAVFVSSHMLAELEQMCDRVCVIDRGTVVGTRTIAEIHRSSVEKTETEYTVECDSSKAVPVLERLGFSGEATQSCVHLRMTRDRVPSVIKELAAADVDIYAFTPVEQSLEDAFIEMTGESVLKGGEEH